MYGITLNMKVLIASSTNTENYSGCFVKRKIFILRLFVIFQVSQTRESIFSAFSWWRMKLIVAWRLNFLFSLRKACSSVHFSANSVVPDPWKAREIAVSVASSTHLFINSGIFLVWFFFSCSIFQLVFVVSVRFFCCECFNSIGQYFVLRFLCSFAR